ncbi:hypothetical protein PACTADRAFT_47211 [Pachysolen tannophilus NRRL Y-2460]|uniref:CAP-Gly domain-containing protein n=1 Tax=Pachysolen tannophilus NRRL Y-2460 TaxID=669874 RepID=A0A1E4TMU4_PACTA|nr:hypothetical protein PACTADRAFT_47211 [Pachysolen tannophilus NRRL Y-2460]
MDFDLPLGLKVQLPGISDSAGILKFIGRVEGKNGVFAGIELIGDSVRYGKNSGDVDGVRYFTTKIPNSGLFLPYPKLVASNQALIDKLNTPTRPQNKHRSQDSSVNSENHTSTEIISPLSARELKLQLNKYKQEIEQRNNVLVDLQKGLDDLEREMILKDEKLLKQKQAYEEQRKELRDAINTLKLQASESEKIYNMELEKLQKKLEAATTQNDDKKELNELKETHKIYPANQDDTGKNAEYESNGFTKENKIINSVIDKELLVYKPETKIDPSAGRKKWCGLCEKPGHDSIDCESF